MYASSLHLLISFLFLCVFLFLIYLLFVYCLTVFPCSAAPCALTSHLWSAVCPMCHITLARTFHLFWLFLVLSFLILSLIFYNFLFLFSLWFFLFSWCMNIEVFLPECLSHFLTLCSQQSSCEGLKLNIYWHLYLSSAMGDPCSLIYVFYINILCCWCRLLITERFKHTNTLQNCSTSVLLNVWSSTCCYTCLSIVFIVTSCCYTCHYTCVSR